MASSTRGRTGHPTLATQPLPAPTPASSAPSDSSPAATPPSGSPRPRRLRWLVRLLRTYLTATLLLVAVVLLVTPAPAEPAPGYRQETIRQPSEGGFVETVSWWALRATAWSTGQAAERQRDLLQANPLDVRLLAPATGHAAGWVAAHRLPVELTLVLLIALVVFYGVYARPSRRWWLTTALLAVVAAVTVNFPTAPLTVASAPGLTATRQVTNWTSGHLLTPDAGRAEHVQADAAEGLWTGLVTGTHSRLETGSNILVRVPATHRTTVTAFLRDHGVTPASGLQAAIIAGFGLLSVVPWVGWVTASSLLGATAQSLSLLLMLAGLILVPLWGVRGQVRRLLVWWLLPLVAAFVLTSLMAVASLGATQLVVAATTTWEALVSLVSGAAMSLANLLLAGWWGRRQVRGWRQRPPRAWRSAARFLVRDPAATPATDGAAEAPRKAGAA